MSVSVLFPYRPDGGQRDRLASWVTARWQHYFPDFELVRGEPAYNQPFNRSQAINKAFKDSHGTHIIVADLDTIFCPEDIDQSFTLIEGGALWGYAFRGYFNLTQEFTESLLEKPPSEKVALQDARFQDWGFENVSGMIVMTRQAFREIGGFDEDFKGWGWEDFAFDAVATKRLGPPFRVPQGYVLHLWHPLACVDRKAYEKNREHYESEYVGRDLQYVRKWLTP